MPPESIPYRAAALLPAGGSGTRLGGERKQYRRLGDAPLLVQTLRAFEAAGCVHALVVAAPAGDVAHVESLVAAARLTTPWRVVAGGATRQASVGCALAACPSGTDVVLVHDAVRPFVSPAHIRAVAEAAHAHGAAALAVPVADTLRRGDGARFGPTVSREGMWAMQTPQAARRDLLTRAHARAQAEGQEATDEVALLQAAGYEVRIVEGDARNFKVTTPGDWAMARALWR